MENNDEVIIEKDFEQDKNVFEIPSLCIKSYREQK